MAGLKVLAYSDSKSGATDFSPDSLVLILADGPVTFTSATDWTLQVEQGAWPTLPSWSWAAESWRYEELDSPIGTTGFDVIRGFSYLFNEVGEIVGVEISFDDGTLRLTAGESVTYEVNSAEEPLPHGESDGATYIGSSGL